jgi:hypothetical protein
MTDFLQNLMIIQMMKIREGSLQCVQEQAIGPWQSVLHIHVPFLMDSTVTVSPKLCLRLKPSFPFGFFDYDFSSLVRACNMACPSRRRLRCSLEAVMMIRKQLILVAKT